MKKLFRIGVREIHARFYSVKAENEEEAKELVNRRDPSVVDEEFLEYANELGQDTWSVEEVPDKANSPSQQQEDTQP